MASKAGVILSIAVVASAICSWRASASCIGDCDRSGTVGIGDIRSSIGEALAGTASCMGIDVNDDGTTSIEEVCAAVRASADGCSVSWATPQIILHGLPAALLSISGTSASDVYGVGGDPPDDDLGPYLLRYDGIRWQRLGVQGSGALWWITVTPIDGMFYLSGSDGMVLELDPSTQALTRHSTPGVQTIFGIWGLHAHRIWAVGADLQAPSGQGGVIWRYDGAAWSVEDLSTVLPQGVPPLFKVWGRSDDDVYAVGAEGVVLHYNGMAWRQLESESLDLLLTVHGNDTATVAVGGLGVGVILERAGLRFVDRTPLAASQLNGVFLPPRGGGVAVGVAGEYALRVGSAWRIQDRVDTRHDFHAAWVDPEGGIWMVGGDLSTPLDQGVLAYAGSRTISSEIATDLKSPAPFADAADIGAELR